MIFYSEDKGHYSHMVRIVLAEKDIACEIKEFDPEGKLPEELPTINPYNKLPVLVDREVTIYEPRIILEYLDERFPHPPLLPVYPVARANSRSLMLRINREICPLLDNVILGKGNAKKIKEDKENLLHEISSLAPTFKEYSFFMNDEFSLTDCYLAPILWRLPSLGINLPLTKNIKPLLDYQEKIFERPGFQDSLSIIERDLRD